MSKGLPQAVEVQFGWDAQGIPVKGNFLLTPAGAFYVGAEENRRLVAITKPFYLQETPVTQAQFFAVTGKSQSHNRGRRQNPVEMVAWVESVDFAKKLSQITGLHFRLPLSLEWEYAARGGDGDKYLWAGSNEPDDVAWTKHNSGNGTQPVKQKKPNGYGLYEMSGNVGEWCQDGDQPEYPKQELIDYEIQSSGRPIRGGNWQVRSPLARISSVDNNHYVGALMDVGFRLVLDVPE